jgi:hypothetical protein
VKEFLKNIKADLLNGIHDDIEKTTANSAKDPDVAVFCAFADDTSTIL